MLRYLVILVVGCAVLCWRQAAIRDWSLRMSRQRLLLAGWLAAMFVLVLAVVAAEHGGRGYPAVLIVLAVALLVLCAPPPARRAAPVAMALAGLAGTGLALSGWPTGGNLASGLSRSSAPADNPLVTGTFVPVAVLDRAEAWHIVLLLQSVALMVAGMWLILSRDVRRIPAMADRAATSRGWFRERAWALLLPLAGVSLVLLADHVSPSELWFSAALSLGLALLVAWLFPAVAADLAAVAVIVLALWGAMLAQAPPPTGWSPFARFPVVPGADWRLVVLGAAEAGALVAFGIWLVPRTIVPHLRSLLRPGPDPELAGRVQQLTRTRADAVDTAAAELRRVERDLHDGAQARLVALGMNLRAAERLIATSPDAAIALVAEARETSSKALTELRGLVRGIYPPVLADRGLADAVRALALDTPLHVETDIELPGRVDAPVESACYFAVAEALANAVKHSGARLVQIRIRFDADLPRSRTRRDPAPGVLRIEVTDNGTGGADPARGTGLQGVERRLAAFDGILAVSSPPGGPTMIIIEVPCALSSPKTFTS